MSFLRSARASHPKHQSGSVLVTVGVGLSAMVILLASLDLGFLYFYKREYQKAADIAAMAGAASLIVADGSRNCVGGATPAAQASALGNLGSRPHAALVECGRWTRAAATPEGRFDVSAAAEEIDAVRVVVSGTPPSFMLGAVDLTIRASAIAVASQPVAQLRIRSAVVDLEDGVLNDVTGALLGGSISLSAASWEGLLNTDINLLSYLDALALDLGVDAGNYDEVLGADVTLGQLLGVAADVLNQGGGTGDVGAAAGGLDQLSVLSLPAYAPLLQLGDLLNVQSGTPAAGLDTNLNVLDLVQGSVQLASAECAVCATVPINLPGVAGVQIRTQIIEPPQLSAIGRPDLAAANPTGPDQIFVRTAQARVLVSVDLPIIGSVLTTLQTLLSNPLVSGITGAVNNLLTLNLKGLVTDILCLVLCGPIPSDIVDIQVLSTPRVDVYIEAGAGEAYVSDYSCDSGKSLDVPTSTAAANIRVGKLGTSAADAASKVFAKPSTTPTVDPVALLDIGSYHVLKRCLVIVGCSYAWATNAANSSYTAYTSSSTRPAAAFRTAFSGGGIGIKAVVPVAGTDGTEAYTDPPVGDLPELGEDPSWHSVSSTDIVDSLTDSLTGLDLEFYQPINGNLLGGVLSLVGSVANTLVSTLEGIIDAALAPLLDPLVDFLLDALGLNVNQVDVGANLSCGGGGATLVD